MCMFVWSWLVVSCLRKIHILFYQKKSQISKIKYLGHILFKRDTILPFRWSKGLKRHWYLLAWLNETTTERPDTSNKQKSIFLLWWNDHSAVKCFRNSARLTPWWQHLCLSMSENCSFGHSTTSIFIESMCWTQVRFNIQFVHISTSVTFGSHVTASFHK